MSKQEQIEAADHDGPSQSQKAFQAQVDMSESVYKAIEIIGTSKDSW